VRGTLEASDAAGTTVAFALAYPKARGATATLTGTAGGRDLRATMPAP
jgi:hypothetical protein